MKKLLALLMGIVMAVCTLFAFVGCDAIAPLDPTGQSGEQNGPKDDEQNGPKDDENDPKDDENDPKDDENDPKDDENDPKGDDEYEDDEYRYNAGELTGPLGNTISAGGGATAGINKKIPETYNGTPVSIPTENGVYDSETPSARIPISLVAYGSDTFTGNVNFGRLYFQGDNCIWGNVYVDKSYDTLFGGLTYTYKKSGALAPDYYLPFGSGSKIVPAVWWTDAKGDVTQALAVSWVESVPTDARVYLDSEKFEVLESEDYEFMSLSKMNCNIISVNGSEVNFSITESYQGQLKYRRVDEGDQVTEEWANFNYSGTNGRVPALTIQKTVDWGTPKACLDSHNQPYVGFVVENRILGYYSETTAKVTYYIELECTGVWDNHAEIVLKVRDVQYEEFKRGDVKGYGLWKLDKSGVYSTIKSLKPTRDRFTFYISL